MNYPIILSGIPAVMLSAAQESKEMIHVQLVHVRVVTVGDPKIAVKQISGKRTVSKTITPFSIAPLFILKSIGLVGRRDVFKIKLLKINNYDRSIFFWYVLNRHKRMLNEQNKEGWLIETTI